MFRVVLSALFCLFLTTGFSQVKNTKSKMAEGLLEQEKYYEALNIYIEIAEKDQKNKYAVEQVAKLYDQLNHAEEAALWYNKLISLGIEENPKVKFRYAQLIKTQGKYEEAILNFKEFNSSYKGHDRNIYIKLCKQEIESCELAMASLPNAEIKVESYTQVNHAYNDLAPLFYEGNFYLTTIPTDSAISYTDYIDSIPRLQIYKAYKSQNNSDTNSVVGSDSLAYFLPNLIQEEGYHSGNLAFSNDGKRLYFTRCKKNLKGEMICKIYASKKQKGKWLAPVKLDDQVNDPNNEYSSTHPTLGFDDRRKKDILYFSSNRPNGQGMFDIWTVNIDTLFNSEVPKNLGGRVNSPLNDITPYYDFKKEILYFASNGLISFGGYDIFKMVDKGRGRFGDAVHLMAPVNSSYDDFYYTRASSSEAYFVSNRKGSKKYLNQYLSDDIYKETFVGKKYIKVIAFANDSSKQQLKEAFVLIKNPSNPIEDGITIKSEEVFQVTPEKEYLLLVQKDEFINQSKVFEVSYDSEVDTLIVDFLLNPIALEKEIVLNTIYFESNSVDLKPESKAGLDAFLQVLFDNPDLLIEISAHTDNEGTTDFNLDLSQKRAEVVLNYLLSKGIGENRLKAIGYGSSMPVGDNSTEEGRSLNRRISFKVLGYTSK